MPSKHLELLDKSIEAIHTIHKEPVQIGVILGSGLSAVAESFPVRTRILYDSLPYFPKGSVAGHPGSLVIVDIKPGLSVAFFQGRVHAYEGHGMEDVVYPVRLLKRMGAQTLIVTNASGGINPDFKPGDLMLMEDHLNLTGTNPLVGPNDESIGPRFFDMTQAYCPNLKKIAREAAEAEGIPLQKGVYAAVMGPSYETPAEVRMLRTLGADAVGMSTVPEVIAARHMNMDVLGISCIANAAAGVSPDECLTHEDVLKTMQLSQTKLNALMQAILKKLI